MREETGFDWVTPTQMVKLARDASRAARWSERRPIFMVILRGLLQWLAFIGLLVGIGSVFGWVDRGASQETVISVSVGIVSLLIIGFSHRQVRSVFQSSVISQVRKKNATWLQQRRLRKLEQARKSPTPRNWNFFSSLFSAVGERLSKPSLVRRFPELYQPYLRRLGLTAVGISAPIVMILFFVFDGGTLARSLLTQLSGREQLEGRARVIDGQTLIVARQKVRLQGIDAPELSQNCRYNYRRSKRSRYWSCGRRAAAVLKGIVRAEKVSCQGYRDSKLGVLTAVCTVRNKNINSEMVTRGYAWVEANSNRVYLEMQSLAKKAKNGVWRGQSDPPWEYREKVWKAAEKNAPKGCPIKGNINSKGRLYYVPWSPSYRKIRIRTKKGERWFCSEQQAVKAGWRSAS